MNARVKETLGYYGTPILGKTLQAVEVSPDRELLSLRFTDCIIRYRAYGDCCSYSWVEHLTVPDLGDGAVVLSIKDSDGVYATPEQKAKSDAEQPYGTDCLTVYHTAIATAKGEVIIEYRNDSNGYYGGSLDESSVEPLP